MPETEFSLGRYGAVVDAVMVDLQRSDVIRRMWRCDHAVWNDAPTEITDRLGWLTVTDLMREHLSDLGVFGDQLRVAGYKHVVLLGMGGSSLGP